MQVKLNHLHLIHVYVYILQVYDLEKKKKIQ